MRVVGGGHGAQDANAIEQLRRSRHQLADADTGDVAGDGLQLAAHFDGRVILGIPGFVLRRPTQMKEQNARLGLAEGGAM